MSIKRLFIFFLIIYIWIAIFNICWYKLIELFSLLNFTLAKNFSERFIGSWSNKSSNIIIHFIPGMYTNYFILIAYFIKYGWATLTWSCVNFIKNQSLFYIWLISINKHLYLRISYFQKFIISWISTNTNLKYFYSFSINILTSSSYSSVKYIYSS